MIETILILILSTENYNKLINFLTDSVSITSEHILDKKQKFHQVTHMKMIHLHNYRLG